MSEEFNNSQRKFGRPLKSEPPRIPYEELDRLLVFGEVVPCDDGENTTVYYPSHRELADRYDVSHSIITRYSKQHNCGRRRKQARARIEIESDRKLVDLRSTAVAISKDDELRIINTYLIKFEKAMAEGRVRFDNPTDFNTMLRLKQFIQGGADSRQEIHASLSLEDLQARHRQMLKTIEESSAAERGEVGNRVFAAQISAPQATLPPSVPPERAPEKASGDFFGDISEVGGGHFPEMDDGQFSGHLSRRETEFVYDEDADDEGLNAPARHSPNLGHTEAHVPSNDYDDVERGVE